MKGINIMKNTRICFLTGSLMVAMLGLSNLALAETTASGESIKNLEHIQWSKSGNMPFQVLNPSTLPANETNLIFIRPLDNDGLQTSANIAIDGRFQVSLQPGHYSQVRYCSGEHNITVVPTGAKTNDLSNSYSHLIDFVPQQNHYIFVDIDDATGVPTLSKLDEEYAQNLLSTQTKQTHQISRVVRDCPPAVIVMPEPEPEPVVKVEIDKPINLEVLFEFDKAVVQPVFNARIEAVAAFMHKYPDTSTVIEGHTDSKGSDSYNMALSQRRAEAVKQELVTKYGIAPNRLRTVGYGESRPVDTNATAAGRANNRRVVATVSATQK